MKPEFVRLIVRILLRRRDQAAITRRQRLELLKPILALRPKPKSLYFRRPDLPDFEVLSPEGP